MGGLWASGEELFGHRGTALFFVRSEKDPEILLANGLLPERSCMGLLWALPYKPHRQQKEELHQRWGGPWARVMNMDACG